MEETQITTTHPGPSWKNLLAGLVIALVIAGGYFALAKKFNWPLGKATENQQTYSNEPYKFQISYPKTWHVQECNDSSPEGEYVLASFGDAEDLVICNSDAPIQGYINIGAGPGTAVNEQEVAGTMEALDDARRSNVTLDGQPAIRVEGLTKALDGHIEAGQKLIMLQVAKDTVLYRIFFIGDTANAKLFDDTLKTFTFGDCKLQQIQCITTPCDPILMCSNPNAVKEEDGKLCAQVITTARNIETGEIKDYPTPCDIPEGWEKI